MAGISLFAAVFVIFFDFFNTLQRFPPRSYIGGINVSGLEKTQAIERLNSASLESAFGPMVYFVSTGESFTYSPSEVGVYIKAEESVEQAFSLSHKESYLKELKMRLSRERLGFPVILDAHPASLEAAIKEIAGKVESVAQNAAFDLDEKTGAYHISEDFPGRRLNIEETMLDCRLRLNEEKNTFSLVFEYYEQPRVTEAALRAHPPVYKLGSFTTYYGSHDSPNRIHNIKLIASWINNTLMMPEEEFSLVKAIGNFSPERGFKEAYVIVGDALIPQYGGGTCQIGTTLYNTAALADLEILSRRNHSLYFNIYPLGRDATVYPGQSDFRFKNDSGNPICLTSKATNRSLTFTIYGTSAGKKVEFSTPEVFALTQNRFVRSSRWSVLRSNLPFRTIVTRKVFDKNGNLIKEESIKSFYKLYGDSSNVKIIRKEPR